MTNEVLAIVVIAESLQLLWLGVITAAFVSQRRRHDRLLFRVTSLSKSVTKTGRMRHTGSQPAVGADTRLTRSLPPPPFPVPPPSTNPISSAAGRHSAT